MDVVERAHVLGAPSSASVFLTHCSASSHSISSGEYGIALNEFSRAVTLQPEFAHAHNNYGVVLEKTGRLEEAAYEYQEAIRLQVRGEVWSQMRVMGGWGGVRHADVMLGM